MKQQTIAKEIELGGRGLFTGCPVTLRFRPAEPDSGVVFVRSDQPEPISISVNPDNLTKRDRRSSLRNGAVTIETVEHCLAAIRGVGLDNVTIDIDNIELPAGDGSSRPFTDALLSAGLVEQSVERHLLTIDETVRVSEGDAELVAWPGEPDRLDIYYELDYGSESPVGRQLRQYSLDTRSFLEEIAPARTFVTAQEANELRARGLGTHLSYSDILVIDRDGPVQNVFRFPDECVRHKILDLVGDLMLSGGFVCGRVYARKSGHGLNHALVRRLAEQRAARDRQGRVGRLPQIDIRGVQRILPHRFPMLMVDRVVELEEDRRAVGIKNVTINEPFFEGHYPRQPIMPGVLLIEAMAQLGGILLSQKLEHTGKVAVLLSLDRVKFRRPVTPGDQLILEAVRKRVKSRTGEVFCRASVAGELAAEANIRFMLVDADPN